MTQNALEAREPFVLFDVELVRVDRVKNTLTFRHEGCALVLRACSVATWPPGAIGRLTLRASGEVGFLIYADPRLRRAAELDPPGGQHWAWRVGEYHFCVRAGVVPGVNGAVVNEDVEPLALSIPREFIELCTDYAITPEGALRAFIADVCGIRNSFVQPREDGYSSLGSDERDFAKAYWLRAHAEPDD
jgi:hypothetical protein